MIHTESFKIYLPNSEKITLKAGIRCAGVGGNIATAVKPPGTSAKPARTKGEFPVGKIPPPGVPGGSTPVGTDPGGTTPGVRAEGKAPPRGTRPVATAPMEPTITKATAAPIMAGMNDSVVLVMVILNEPNVTCRFTITCSGPNKSVVRIFKTVNLDLQ